MRSIKKALFTSAFTFFLVLASSAAWSSPVETPGQPFELLRRTAKTAAYSSRSSPKPNSRSFKRSFTAVVTAYCSCFKCCGKSDGVTASGTRASWGTVAAPKWIPFGTKLLIEGFSCTFTVEDRGGAIKGNRIDIWFPSHQEALQFGRRRLKVVVLSR